MSEEKRTGTEKSKYINMFSDISEIRDIIASANMGIWRIEIKENEQPRMYADETMSALLGFSDKFITPEEVYTFWFSQIHPDAVQSVLNSVERMKQGYFDENTYLWIHPVTGVRYVRCGGTAEKIPGGISLRGYHYDVDEVVRAEHKQTTLLKKTEKEKNEYYATLGALGDIFYSMHVINLAEDTAIEFNARNEVKQIANHRDGAVQMMSDVMHAVISDEYLEAALEFSDLTTVADRMKDKILISKQFVGKNIGWFYAKFITMEKDIEGKPTKVIFTTRIIDEEKKYEQKLIHNSNTDELTGLLNRRAYDADIYDSNFIPDDDRFIYVSIDVNGLKVVNDTKGHEAGDELIAGVCQCMKRCLGPYGRLYRTGGDEFVAVLLCDESQLESALNDYDKSLGEWSGKYISGLSVSYGISSIKESPGETVRSLAATAEKRMYEAKSAYYRRSGMDRRGQQDVHKALCALYTKILKVNISEDTYQVVNITDGDNPPDNRISGKISEWLDSFGRSGQIHPDDADEFLRKTDLNFIKKHFAEGKKSLRLFYRRKYGSEFEQVMNEIIPADDYSHDNQTLYMYVKNIDK